jgi:hypothetical protein
MRREAIFALLAGCAAPAGGGPDHQARADCPAGTQRDGDVCRPLLVLDCPAGTSFREGIGCVATVAPEPLPSSSPTGAAATPTASSNATPPPDRSATGAPSADPSPALGPCGCKPADQICLMQCGPRPAPITTARPSREFDRAAASTGLIGAARSAQVCRRIPGPTGPGKVKLVFQPSGTVREASVDPPYADTPTGDCVLKLFVQITVPPFQGEPVAVSKTFRID